jgi:hypothetical protein
VNIWYKRHNVNLGLQGEALTTPRRGEGHPHRFLPFTCALAGCGGRQLDTSLSGQGGFL